MSISDIASGFGSDTVVITSPELVEGPIHDQADALAVLAEQAAPVDLADLSIDALGRVVMRNQAFVDELRRKSEHEAASSNFICGFRCSAAWPSSVIAEARSRTSDVTQGENRLGRGPRRAR